MDGVRVTVEMWSNRRIPSELADAAIDEYARVRRLTDVAEASSALALVNARAVAQPVRVGAEIFALFDLTLELAARTGGAFDATTVVASAASAAADGSPLDFRGVELDRERGTVRFAAPQLRLDPNTVATGHALAFAADFLRTRGVENARLIARGVAYYIGDRRGRPWLHGVSSMSQPSDTPDAPDSGGPSGRLAQLSLSDVAVASVGSFALLLENESVFFENELVAVGVPSGPEHRPLRSATVFGPNPLIAEGLAHAVLELGAVAGFERLGAFPGYDAIIFDWSGEVAHTAGLNVVYGGASVPSRLRRPR